MRRTYRAGAAALAVLLSSCGGQMADRTFDTRVTTPTYASHRPRLLFDAAHRNSHRVDGTYRPFAELMRSDGFDVGVGRAPLSAEVLAGHDLLVIANAKGPGGVKYAPAFTAAEVEAVERWVGQGGALLLIVDHEPFGAAAQSLAERFGVRFSDGMGVEDPAHSDPRDPSQLVFSTEDSLLGDHPITRGRDGAERVKRVMSFTGAAVSGPPAATAILRLSPTATEHLVAPGGRQRIRQWTGQVFTRTTFGDPQSVAGMAQMVAFEHGRGRVVVSGEAAMLTAQTEGDHRFGMNAPGSDDRQLVLNVVHWLVGTLK